ncbi:MAG: ABC transporter permease [Rhodobacterales bacterium]|nr:ABC transporter permease [Rhodobacterales bacterium]MDX5501734.1 ABC transporter permease [Rhodobacterales bacterium]
MASRTAPFSRFEWMIAWRYMRGIGADGGVSVVTIISLMGITLAVFALVATLAVRSGFRTEFVDTILGANAHVTVYASARTNDAGRIERGIRDYDAWAERLATVPDVLRAAPLIRGQIMANANGRNAGAEVFGITLPDLRGIPRVAGDAADIEGEIDRFDQGIAIGSGLARELGVMVGDRIKLISPEGVKTAFGTSPRVNAYEVVAIFTAGRWDIDRTRIYMPFAEAQSYFNREGQADEIEVMVRDPDAVDDMALPLMQAAGEGALIWTWRDASGSFLRALTVEDNVMFVILGILVLIASLNIIAGLIMLVRTKSRAIGILRTMGLTEGAVLRIFFLCGVATGVTGTALGLILGVLFVQNIDFIFAVVNGIGQGGVWDPSIRGIYALPAELRLVDVLKAAGLSLGLSFVVTLPPAWRAARMNPVEALRHE